MARSTHSTTMLTQLTEIAGPNTAIAPMIVPPDGGWGWVIVMTGLITSAIIDGCVYCFYLFREPMSEELHVSQAEISYLTSMNGGFYFVGVLACSFGNHWGFRATMLTGSVLASVSYCSGYFFKQMFYYYIAIGVIAGIGSGFLNMAANLPAGFYFDKKRSIAMGIVSCGSGLGGIFMPMAVELFMSQYGWRDTYVFEGGLLGTAFLMGLLIRPLRPVMIVIDVESSDILRGGESLIDFAAFRPPPPLPPDTASFASMSKSVLDRTVLGKSVLGRSTVTEAPATSQRTIAQMVDDTSLVSIRVKSETANPSVITRLHQMSVCRGGSQIQMSVSNYNNIRITQEPFIRQRLPWYKCGCCRSKEVRLPPRPLMRTDLYYAGSLYRLPEYTRADRDLEYHMQVTRVPTYYQTVHDLTKTYTLWCCANIFGGLRYLFDYTLFKSLTFDCLAICGIGVYAAFYLPYIFFKVHLEQFGAGSYASQVISMMGLGGMIGRILSGIVVTAFPKFNARIAVCTMTMVASVSIVCVVFFDNLYYKGACLFVFGFTVGFFVPLRSIIIVDYFGLQKLTAGTGVLFICLGLGSFLGPIVAEKAKNMTNNVDAPFYVAGVALLISALALVPMDWLSKWENKRAERKKIDRMQNR